MNNVINYINKKREFIKKDYKLLFIFENLIILENEELYYKKIAKLEEKTILINTPKKMEHFFKSSCVKKWKKEKILGIKTIHIANLSGFSSVEIAYNDNAYTNDTVDVQASIFLSAFEKLVSDPNAVPQNSIIILSTDEHHMSKKKNFDKITRSAEKKRKIAAESKGQQSIERYFKSTKSVHNKKSNDEASEQYKIEEIITRTRGKSCNIEILWLPNVELNPCNYVSIVFNSEVMRYLEDNEDTNLKDACLKVIDTLPNSIWNTYYDFINDLEEMLLEEKQKNRKKLSSSDSENCD